MAKKTKAKTRAVDKDARRVKAERFIEFIKSANGPWLRRHYRKELAASIAWALEAIRAADEALSRASGHISGAASTLRRLAEVEGDGDSSPQRQVGITAARRAILDSRLTRSTLLDHSKSRRSPRKRTSVRQRPVE